MAILKRQGIRGTTYRVVVYVQGKQRWRTFKTLNDARAFESKARLGQVGSATRITTGDFLDQWFHELIEHSDRDPNTIANVRLALEHAKPVIGGILLKNLGPMDLQRLVGALRQGFAPGTVRLRLGVVQTALKRAQAWGLILRSPFEGVEVPSQVEPDVKAWDEEQLSLFLGAARREQSPYYGVYLLIAHTGLRLGECLGLRWSDVDLLTEEIRPQQQFTHGLLKEHLKTRGSKGRVSLAGDAGLITYLSGLPREGDLVFSKQGIPIWPQQVQRDMKRRCERLRLPVLSPKDLRHTHATMLARLKVPVKVIQERLRHSNPATTLRFYTAALPGMQDEAARKIGEVLSDE